MAETIRALLEAGADPREGYFLARIEASASSAEPEWRDQLQELVRQCHAIADRLDLSDAAGGD